MAPLVRKPKCGIDFSTAESRNSPEFLAQFSHSLQHSSGHGIILRQILCVWWSKMAAGTSRLLGPYKSKSEEKTLWGPYTGSYQGTLIGPLGSYTHPLHQSLLIAEGINTDQPRKGPQWMKPGKSKTLTNSPDPYGVNEEQVPSGCWADTNNRCPLI